MARFTSMEQVREAGITDAQILSVLNRFVEQKAYRKRRQANQRELIRRAKELGLDKLDAIVDEEDDEPATSGE